MNHFSKEDACDALKGGGGEEGGTQLVMQGRHTDLSVLCNYLLLLSLTA